MRGRACGEILITPINSSTNNPSSSQIGIKKWEFFFQAERFRDKVSFGSI